jgi:hypothetical protein
LRTVSHGPTLKHRQGGKGIESEAKGLMKGEE